MSNVSTQLTMSTPLNVALKNRGNFMEKIKDSLSSLNISPDLFRDAVMFELNDNANFGKCTWGSFLQALRASAQAGLIPGKVGGKSYLIPYGTVCQFQISYKGLIDILGRHKIRTRPVVVYENDTFDYDLPNDKVIHKVTNWNDRGELKLVYTVFTFDDGFVQNHIMTKKEIDHIRDNFSQAAKKSGSIWEKHYDAMAIKTCIKRGCKYIQVPYDVAQAIHEDDKADMKANAIDVSSYNMANEGADPLVLPDESNRDNQIPTNVPQEEAVNEENPYA